jgi:hypothetical protein
MIGTCAPAPAPARLYPMQVERISSQAMWNIIILSALSLFMFVFHQILTILLLSFHCNETYFTVVGGDSTDLPIPTTATAQSCQRSLRFTNNPIAKKAHVGDLNVLYTRLRPVRNVICG